MKRSLYNMALAICTAAAMYSCSLDEYNPSYGAQNETYIED